MNPFKNSFVCVALIIIQLFCIVFTNTYGLIRDYYRLNYPDDTHSEILKIGWAIGSSPIFKTYANYTGTNSGYGFYSPNVGNEFIMSFAVLDHNGKLLGEHQHPLSLEQNESRSRFNLCTFPMMKRIMLEEPNEIYDKHFKVMMHQIAKDIKVYYDTGHKVISEVYIHRYPKIEAFLNGDTEKFKLLERHTFKF